MVIPTRAFKEDEYYSTVLGDPKLRYLQHGVYYDTHKNPVKGKAIDESFSEEQKDGVKKLSAKVKDYAARAAKSKITRAKNAAAVEAEKAEAKSAMMDTQSFNIPQATVDAEKENLLAKHVEDLAG